MQQAVAVRVREFVGPGYTWTWELAGATGPGAVLAVDPPGGTAAPAQRFVLLRTAAGGALLRAVAA